MLPQIPSAALQQQLTEVIRIMAKRDLRPLEGLLHRSEESLVQILVDIIGSLEGEKPYQLLLKTIHHPSERVRKNTLKHLIARDPQAFEKVFPLIEDPSETVRRMMLERLGQSRSEVAESLLLHYLAHRRFKLTNREHLLACYRALGRCGSRRSIPFLRGLLLDGGWIPRFCTSLHRRGAAVALMALETDEAKETLERASKSLVPSVRLASRWALEASR
jgi:HEAT repeat protein